MQTEPFDNSLGTTPIKVDVTACHGSSSVTASNQGVLSPEGRSDGKRASEITNQGGHSLNVANQGKHSLVVSIHDVSPVTRRVVEQMLLDLRDAGVATTSLLVIPDHHHLGRIDDDAEFAAWIRDQVGCGHEPVLHGFYHLRLMQKDEGWVTRFLTRYYTAGEGEFHDLSFSEAVALLCKGREALSGCGVETTGFIAPAWLLGAEAERAVWQEGFDYTTRIASVIDCKAGPFAARSMVYSVRSGWRRAVSLLWNELLFHSLRNESLLRIGLHPPDWKHDGIRSHVLKCIRMAAAVREVTTYRDWLRQRIDSTE